ncbi:MAG: hypothetical protein CMJ83_12820 [Planctomycetes bacterium]|nr:hypothetical protein [Planctomycetota bacterium]
MIRTPMKIRALEPQEDRFSRHALIDGWDQDRLARLRVAVFGIGALGNEVVKNLALVGVGHALLVDLDRVEASNLSRSVLFRPGDEGRPKAVVAAERAREIYPKLDTRTVTGDLWLELGPGCLESYDLALACLDSVDARLGVNSLCLRAGLAWWNGGLGDAACEVTHYVPGDGPCYGCTLTSRARARELQRFSCQHGRPQDLPPRTLPTTAVSASLGGALLVQEALASVMPEWESRALPAGTRLLLETAPYRLTRFEIARDPGCPDHELHDEEPTRLEDIDHAGTAADVLSALGADRDRVEIHLDFDLVVRWNCGCPGGGREPFVPVRGALGPCRECNSLPGEFETVTSLPGDHPAFDLPLHRLGVPDGGEIIIYDGDVVHTARLRPSPKETVA